MIPDDYKDDELVQVNHNVPKTVKETAKANTDFGELSEYVRNAYEIAAFGQAEGQRSQLKLELQQLRDKKDRLRGELRDIQTQIEDIEQRETRVEERLDDVKEADQKYEGHLESIETQMYDGMRVFPGHGAIDRAATIGGKRDEDVIADLQERNPALPDHAFESAMDSDREWHGVSNGDSA